MQPIFYIPNDAGLVVVSDFFAEDLIGGAELTLQAILDKCPVKYFKIRCSQFTNPKELIESAGKDKHWLLVNFSGMSREALVELATSGVKYSILECDYKYCMFRSSHLHKLQTKQDCDCHLQEHGRFICGLYKRAQQVFFMSEGQMNEYKRLFPMMNSWPEGKLVVQGSTFSNETLDRLDQLYHEVPKINKAVVLGGGTWIKNQPATEEYCKKNNIEYDVIGGMPYEQFIEKIARYSKLVFMPAGADTAPRITMEAKLLGLNLDLNENVQHKDESWFTGSREAAMLHLRDRASNFWKAIPL